MERNKYIRFDWAMKRMLRDKANYAVLEGLLTTLFNEKITINRLFESESSTNIIVSIFLRRTAKTNCLSSRCRTMMNTPISRGCCLECPSW